MFGSFGKALSTSITFVSQAAINNPVLRDLQLNKTLAAVHTCRDIKKADMIHNNWQPVITVDPQTYLVYADGERLLCEPATELPMAQRYFLF